METTLGKVGQAEREIGGIRIAALKPIFDRSV